MLEERLDHTSDCFVHPIELFDRPSSRIGSAILKVGSTVLKKRFHCVLGFLIVLEGYLDCAGSMNQRNPGTY